DPFEDFGSGTSDPWGSRGIRRADSLSSAFLALADGGPARRRFVTPTDLPGLSVAGYGVNSVGDGRPFGTRDFGAMFFRRCWRELRDCLLVLDEITLWTDFYPHEYLEKLIFQGRRLNLRMLVAAQRLNLVPTAMRAE